MQSNNCKIHQQLFLNHPLPAGAKILPAEHHLMNARFATIHVYNTWLIVHTAVMCRQEPV